MASKFARFESSWLQHVGNTAREGIQNTHHWSGPIDATDKWLPQWQRAPAWPTPFSVAVSVRPDRWCVICTPIAVFPHAAITGFKSGKFGGYRWGGINSYVIRPCLKESKSCCVQRLLGKQLQTIGPCTVNNKLRPTVLPMLLTVIVFFCCVYAVAVFC